jgi:hypothetical protein
MPDLDQLLDTLVTDVSARSRAPGAPTAIKQAHRRRTKAAAAVAVMVAAAIAAVIAGSALTVTGLDDDRTAPPLEQPEATKNPGLTRPLIAPESLLDVRELGFHIAPVGGIGVSDSWGIDIDGQMTDAVVGGRQAGVKMLYQGRSLRPLTGRSKDVTVNGLPGTYTEAVQSDGYTALLSWRYAPDSWAYVGASYDGEPPPDLRQKYLTIAEAVRPGGKTLLLPVRFGSAPASLPAIANAHRVDFLKDEGESGWTMYLRVDDDVMVSATTAVAPDECLEFTYRGHRGCVLPSDGGGREVGLHLGDVDLTYELDPGRELPVEDMKRLLAGTTVSSTPYDPTTWFDLKTALGG